MMLYLLSMKYCRSGDSQRGMRAHEGVLGKILIFKPVSLNFSLKYEQMIVYSLVGDISNPLSFYGT